jgi:hypothetical protein
MYNNILTLLHREQFQLLRLGYQLHGFMAGEKAMEYSDYLNPWLKNFEPPKQRKRVEDAPFSEEFIIYFEKASELKIVSSDFLARLGIENLRLSGADV